jgi:Uma2 family endonuclease
MVASQEPCITPEEYLEREREADTRSEYVNGQVFAMAGATDSHNLITLNVAGELRGALKGKACRTYAMDMRVQVTTAGSYFYPDITVACGRAAFAPGRRDTLLNPAVVVEVLSPSTEAYDRGAKFFYYRQLESLTDYLLVSQDTMRIEHFMRQPNGLWLMAEAVGPDGVLEIASIGCSLRLADVYDKVDIGSPEAGG